MSSNSFKYLLKTASEIMDIFGDIKNNEKLSDYSNAIVDIGMNKLSNIMSDIQSKFNSSNSRFYLPTLSELVDRLSILQMKEIFIPEYKHEYVEEIELIMHDIDQSLKEKPIEMT